MRSLRPRTGACLRREAACRAGSCRKSSIEIFLMNALLLQYFIPGTEASLAVIASYVKTHWKTGTFPLGGGLSAIAPAIPPADLPALSRRHDVSAH
jgi:hypothetical protein